MSLKHVHIKTFGCQMNVYDSRKMLSLLAPLGYAEVDTPEAADLVLLNTCHIREKAGEKVYSDLGRLHKLSGQRQKNGQNPIVLGVTGCVAQAEQDEVFRRAPYVDLVVGPQAYHRLPELVVAAETKHTGQRPRWNATDFTPQSKFDALPLAGSKQGVSAFLTIQEGCDKFCTFCVVPYTRGAEYSRPVTAIVEEAKILIGEGAREITLLGQNVNAYHHGGVGLGKLLFLLAALPGLDRLRYTTSHPRDVDEELIEAHKNLPSLMPLLHLPVQSGSDKILAAMNRRHTADDYRRVIDRLKNAQPSLQFTSDFIVGFPGETDADFAATLRLVKDVTYAAAFSFKYSPRPGTPAAVLETQVPEAVKTERLATLQALLGQQQHSFNLSLVGTIQPVLIMEASKRPGIMFGKTPFWQSVLVTGNAAPGSISPVLMEEAAPGTLHGRVIDNQLEEATAA